MIDLLTHASAVWLGKLHDIDGLWLFFSQESVQLLVDITVQLLFHPLFLRVVFLPSWILASVTVIAACLLADPLRICDLVSAQFLAVPMPFIRRQHGIKPYGYAYLFQIVAMAAHTYVHRNLEFKIMLLRIQLDVELALVPVIVRQRYARSAMVKPSALSVWSLT